MWLFCTAKINRISVSDCGSRTEPCWEHVLPGHMELCQGRPEAFLGPLVSLQDGQVVSRLLGAGNLQWHSVLPLPCRLSPDSTESLHSSEESRSVWRRGVRDVQWLCGCWKGCTMPGSVWKVPCVTRAVWLRVPEGPCLSMHTIASPKAPYFSLTSQPFS